MTELYRPFQPTLTETGLQCFGLNLEFAPACSVLRGVVHSYLQVSAARPTLYPVVPDGTQAVFISPHGSMIGGAHTQACDIQIPRPGDYFGIHFYPGALRFFFDLDVSEITDQLVESRYFPSREFAGIHEHIYQCRTFHERALMCEQWLLGHFKHQPVSRFDQALSLIYQSSGNVNVNKLSSMVGWSTRHLNRLFRLHTGLSTKTFIQIIRIQRVLSLIHI